MIPQFTLHVFSQLYSHFIQGVGNVHLHLLQPVNGADVSTRVNVLTDFS